MNSSDVWGLKNEWNKNHAVQDGKKISANILIKQKALSRIIKNNEKTFNFNKEWMQEIAS